jgi:two-component system NarL family response regulator
MDQQSAKERVRIVIADDNSAVLNQLVAFLETRFHVVGRASNGLELLEAVRQFAPAVVVTDISMPEMNGLDATRQIKSMYPNIPVVILTAYSDDMIREAAMQAGASAFVAKFRAYPDLLNAIDAVLAKP